MSGRSEHMYIECQDCGSIWFREDRWITVSKQDAEAQQMPPYRAADSAVMLVCTQCGKNYHSTASPRRLTDADIDTISRRFGEALREGVDIAYGVPD